MTPVGTLRIGVDAGGTFTHAVAVRTSDGAVFAAEVPSTPADPSQASGAAIRKILDQADCRPADVSVLIYAAAPLAHALLAGALPRLGLVVTAGFRHLLEAGRQSLPEGGGAAHLWVKPPPPVPLERVVEAGGRIGPGGEEDEPLDEEAVREAARRLREAGAEAVGVCLLHAPANPAHERRAREILEEELPGCALSISSDVLPEPREHERAQAALADAAFKVLMRRALGAAAERAAKALSEETSFLLMKSNGAVIRAREAFDRPLAVALAGPAAGALAGASLARAAGLRKVIAFHAGGASTEVCLIEDGAPQYRPSLRRGGIPIEAPAIDMGAAAAGGGSLARAEEGGLRLGPESAGAEPGPMCFGRGGETPTLGDALLVLGRLPDALAGGGLPLDRARAEAGLARLAGALGTEPEEAAFRVVEEAARAQAEAIREMTVRRGKDPADYVLLATGGLGPATAAEAAGPLGVREVVVPPRPGSEGATGLVETERRNEYTLAHAAPLEDGHLEEFERLYEGLERDAAADLDAEAAPGEARTFLRAAEMRYRGESWKMTIEMPPAASFSASVEAAVTCYHEAYRFRFGFDHRGRLPVETVQLHLTALGRMDHSPRPAYRAGAGAERARKGERRVGFARGAFAAAAVYDRGGLGPGDAVEGPAVVEEAGATTLVPPGAALRVDEGGNLRIRLPAPEAEGGPPPAVFREIVEGALQAAEREMEALLRGAARSPFIHEMGVCRAAIFDRRGRRLTGRAFSPSASPVLAAFSPEEIHEGDVFLWNDAYAPGGGTGRPSELCCCVPVFHRRRLAAFALVSGQHEDIGGASAGGLPAAASQAFQEGLLIPPIKLHERGVPNEAARRLILRNNRRGEDLGADIEAQVTACRAGAARIAELFARYHTKPVNACFEALLEGCARSVGEELLPRVPEGTHAWEDHVESDGVDTHRIHTLRLKMSREGGRLRLDFRGTTPQARGPINWPANRDEGAALKRWLGPLLQNLAPRPGRAGELAINDGILELIETVFPEPGTLITPAFPAATSMGAITLGRLRSLLCGALGLATGGRMPADQENLHWWGLRGRDPSGRFFLFREILGGGTGARPWGDGEDALLAAPGLQALGAEYIEARFPVRVERAGLAEDSGGPGRRRGGLGFFRELRVLCDCEVLSNAPRAFLAPWGVSGGRAGGRFAITINPGSAVERAVPGLSTGVPVIEGDRIRVTTTGGGGWGDPYEREVDRVAEDVARGKVSIDGSMRHYGVVFTAEETPRLDRQGTAALRQFMRARRGRPPFFDHGPNAAVLRSTENNP